MHSKSVLIITAPISSHVIPTIFLSNRLKYTHNIVYCIENEKINSIIPKEFFFEKLNTGRFGVGSDAMFLYNQMGLDGEVISFWAASNFYLKNTMFLNRKKELTRIINKWNPTTILIDIFSSTDFIILFHLRHKINILFFNPMLSTYKNKNIPSISEGSFLKEKKIRLDYSINQPKVNYKKIADNVINFFSGVNPFLQLQLNYFKSGVWLRNQRDSNNPYLVQFKNVPELILAPENFEFPNNERREYQHYLGLCVDSKRTNSLACEEFEIYFNEIKNNSSSKQERIIYCSFGTYFSTNEEHKSITQFLFALIEALDKFENLKVVISVNKTIQNVILKHLGTNNKFKFFNYVDQMKMLSISNVFITHGGLGSVKESIHFKVPLLVYPLDLSWDQTGNAFKVEYHGIGLRGILREDEPSIIYSKICELLSNEKYKNNIKNFTNNILEVYSENRIKNLLETLIK